MITLTLRTKSGGKITSRNIDVPCLWEELTLSQFLELIDQKQLTPIKLLSILTGLSVEFLTKVPAKDIDIASDYLFFMKETPRFGSWLTPKSISFDGKDYIIPKVYDETYGQKVYLQNKINELLATEQSPHLAIPYALALYFYPKVTGDEKFTEEKIQGFIPRVMNLPATQAYPAANFFLTSCVKSLTGKQRTYTLNQLRKNLRRDMLSSRSSA